MLNIFYNIVNILSLIRIHFFFLPSDECFGQCMSLSASEFRSNLLKKTIIFDFEAIFEPCLNNSDFIFVTQMKFLVLFCPIIILLTCTMHLQRPRARIKTSYSFPGIRSGLSSLGSSAIGPSFARFKAISSWALRTNSFARKRGRICDEKEGN